MKYILLINLLFFSGKIYSDIKDEFFDFGFNHTFTNKELKLSFIKKITFKININTELPGDFSQGRFAINRIDVAGRVFLRPFGSTSAQFILKPEIFFKGEDICELEIVGFNFKFKKFKSKLKNDYNRKVLGALNVFDNYDPSNKKIEFIRILNKKLKEFLNEDYCFNYH